MTVKSKPGKTTPPPPEEQQDLPEDELNDLEDLPVNELDELLLADIELPDIPDEPDDEVLALEVQDLENLAREEPLDLLDHPALMVELSEDPVRLYLKEIGGIDLLDTDREFWLATRMEAVRRIETLSRGHPLAWDEAGASKRRTRAEKSPFSPSYLPRLLRRAGDRLETRVGGYTSPAACLPRPGVDPLRSPDAAPYLGC